MVGGVLDFKTLQEQRYMRFWAHFCIVQLVNDEQDCEVVYWGTALMNNYGKEMTGKIFDHGELGNEKDTLLKDYFEAIERNEVSFAHGNLDWKERGFSAWNRVCLPLQKGNTKCCLSVVAFS